MFNTLSKADIYKIIDIELIGLYERVHALGYKVKINSVAKDFIIDKPVLKYSAAALYATDFFAFIPAITEPTYQLKATQLMIFVLNP